MERKGKHLEFIQGTVNRLSTNSFLLKGWSVVLVSALFALASADFNLPMRVRVVSRGATPGAGHARGRPPRSRAGGGLRAERRRGGRATPGAGEGISFRPRPRGRGGASFRP